VEKQISSVEKQITANKESVEKQISSVEKQITANKELILANKETTTETIKASEARIESILSRFNQNFRPDGKDE
jgi:hypothetical protein